MALSKWFLCAGDGAAGGPDVVNGDFEKDEALALTFADKAVKKGLPNAEFAMGYFTEDGVGCPGDIKTAVGWNQLVHSRFLYHLFFFTISLTYQAREHGNQDATLRLGVIRIRSIPTTQSQKSNLSEDAH